MTSRADERAAAIKARLDAINYGTGHANRHDALDALELHAPADLAWLLAEREQLLRELYAVYVTQNTGDPGNSGRLSFDDFVTLRDKALAGADGDA